MINKPPLTGNKLLDPWTRGVWNVLNNTVKSLDVPVSTSGIGTNYVKGKYPARSLTSGNSAFFGFIAPKSLAAVKEVTLRFTPSGTGTIDYTVNMQNAAVGALFNANTPTPISETGVSVTNNLITEINITPMFAAIKAADQIGIELVLDGAVTTTDIQVMSLFFKYI